MKIVNGGTPWRLVHPKATPDSLGLLLFMLLENDPRDARTQLNANYQHGGGWESFPGFTMLPNGNLSYPGDSPTKLLAETKLREEVIRLYEHSWVAVIQPDGSFEICRMD